MALVTTLAGGWGSSLLAFFVGLEEAALPLLALTRLLGTSPGAASTCTCTISCHAQWLP